MICSLFSSFDPSVSLMGLDYQFKWMFMISTFLFVGWNYFIGFSSIMLMFKYCVKFIMNMITSVFKMSYKSVIMIISSLFVMILSLNEMGLVPFSFTPTSHLVYNLSLSIPLWLGGLAYMFMKNWMNALSHLVPSGCPLILIPFLVLIESISLLIRPFSLGVRLMSNIMAGHMIMTLIGTAISKCSYLAGFTAVLAQSVLMMFEMGVVMIQAYVFISLMYLYWEENM